DAVDRFGALAALRDFAGPPSDEGNADASLIQHSLAASQRRVVRDAALLANSFANITADTTVIARKDDDSILSQVQLFQQLQDPADTLVDAVDHRRIS